MRHQAKPACAPFRRTTTQFARCPEEKAFSSCYDSAFRSRAKSPAARRGMRCRWKNAETRTPTAAVGARRGCRRFSNEASATSLDTSAVPNSSLPTSYLRPAARPICTRQPAFLAPPSGSRPLRETPRARAQPHLRAPPTPAPPRAPGSRAWPLHARGSPMESASRRPAVAARSSRAAARLPRACGLRRCLPAQLQNRPRGDSRACHIWPGTAHSRPLSGLVGVSGVCPARALPRCRSGPLVPALL